MEYDYGLLRGAIRGQYGSESSFADIIGMNRSTFSLKLGNKSEFSQYEIFAMADKLGIQPADFYQYFLPVKLRNLNEMEARNERKRSSDN